MKPRNAAVGLLLVVIGFATIAYGGLGLLFLIVGIVVLALGAEGPKCPNCGAHRTISTYKTEVVGQEKTFGITTRRETTRSQVLDQDGSPRELTTTRDREVRVPMVKTTTRQYDRCSNCSSTWFKDSVSQHEDFSRTEAQPGAPQVVQKETTIQREIVKVPCRYCGTLNNLATHRFCSGCGAAVK